MRDDVFPGRRARQAVLVRAAQSRILTGREGAKLVQDLDRRRDGVTSAKTAETGQWRNLMAQLLGRKEARWGDPVANVGSVSADRHAKNECQIVRWGRAIAFSISSALICFRMKGRRARWIGAISCE
jgi:hypothetical protein